MLLPPSPLTDKDRRALLDLARRAVAAAVRGEVLEELPPDPPHWPRRAGAFVSLHRRGHLRGCIGMIEPAGPLADTIARCAVGAAIEDRRFAPISPEELDEIEIEISLLSPLRPARPEEIVVGVHGLMVRRTVFSGLLLPQVATKFRWARERFLEETCRKAGLEPDAWKDPSTRISAFTAEVFSEEQFQGKPQAGAAEGS